MSSRSVELPVARSGDDAETVALNCVREGGRLALERFHQPQAVTVKGRGDLVTQVDLAIETYISRLVSDEFPDHAVLSEESNAGTIATADGWTWVVDPLDGTRNYVSGVPIFCVNVALCLDGQPALAMTYDPVHDELFRAREGGGAWLGEQPVHVSQNPSVQASVIGFDMGYDDARAGHMLSLMRSLWPGVQNLRLLGSAALGLAYAACGRFDLFTHNYLFPWDLAAGILLVREAGGVITDRDGGPVSLSSEGTVAGGAAVHADFLRLAAGKPWRQGGPGSREGG
ncbi:MAG: inositol monophosphatase family protein [Dehalococcoidia bacterium]|jgi:fructose-1,6-bisphosphatase/inositol monophosphatase family enzyme